MSLVATRVSLHTLAEHVMSPARYAVTGRIGLRVTPGGFGTPSFADGRGEQQVFEREGSIHVRRDGKERHQVITTIRAAAEFVGIEPGAPADVYPPVTPLIPDAPLTIDRSYERDIASWFQLANEALRQLQTMEAGAEPSEIQLWPEHFDLAMTIEKVNFGASPGDAEHPEPYLYVGPFERRAGPFWNEPFGASRARGHVTDVAAAVDFFVAGRYLTR
jgi:hypothetical protein